MRRVLYVTGTRADFGLMERTLRLLHAEPEIDLSLFVTGMHLSDTFGRTVVEVERSGLRIAARAATPVDGGDRAEMAEALAQTLSAAVACMTTERPDLVLVLGDRGEMLAAALAALHLGVHIAHIHGGERSGTVDESIRHAISKIAHLHLVATEGSRERLIRMGERPDRIFVTGAPGLDGLPATPLRDRADLAREVGFDPDRPIGLMVFHPVVQQAESAGREVAEVLAAAREACLQTLALMPNSDAGSAEIRKGLTAATEGGAEIVIRAHLPRVDYLDWLAAADVVFGNSSSGIVEAASFGAPVVNIGSRQDGRERNRNTIDVPVSRASIVEAFETALAGGRFPRENVYGQGRAGERIVKLLCSYTLDPADLEKLNTF